MHGFFFRLIGMIAGLLLAGCARVPPGFSTVSYYDYGAGRHAIGLLDAYPVKLLVVDLRPEVLSLDKIPLYVGSAENGWGDPKDVLNRDDCPVPVSVHRTPHCRSLAESIHNRLKPAQTPPGTSAAQGLILIEIRQWVTHAGAELRLDYALDAYIRSASGERLAQATIQGQGELIDTQAVGRMTFANHTVKEYQLSLVLSRILDEKLRLLLERPLANSRPKLR